MTVMNRLCSTTILALLSLITAQNALHAGGQATHGSGIVKPSEVSQQAVLFVEDTNTPRGKAYYGLTTWHTELVASTSGKAESEKAIVAQVGIPGPRMSASLILRRITDQSISGSHAIEISFKLPPTSPGGGVNNVPGILMKVSQGKPGAPLVGTIEKTKNSSFLVSLSSDDAERQHNLQLLKDREWLDVAIVYNNGRRAILSLEKGRSGDNAFSEAFATWKD